MSGFYLVKLSLLSPKVGETYIIFVVREDGRAATFLMNSAVTTYQAYNTWGGYNLYREVSPGRIGTKVSFDRPYSHDHTTGTGNQGQGAGQFFDPYPLDYGRPGFGVFPGIGFEYPMVRFLERGLGGISYDVKYATDIDLHNDTNHILLDGANAFLSVGHDEYWSKPMHDNLAALRDKGKNVAFFSGNSVFWITEILPSSKNVSNRILHVEKNGGTDNPWLWQNCSLPLPPLGTPTCPGEDSEQTLVGSITTDGFLDRGDMQFSTADTNHWLLSGTTLQNGSRIPGLIGYEAQTVCAKDQLNCHYLAGKPVPGHPVPPNQTGLAHSQFQARPSANPGPLYLWVDMSVYTVGTGANAPFVFSAGSPDWSLGLNVFTDNMGPFPSTRYHREHPAIAQMTKNVLAKAAGVPLPPPVTDNVYTADIMGGVGSPPCFTPGQSFTVHFKAPPGRPIFDWNTSQDNFTDAVALHVANQPDDDSLQHLQLFAPLGVTDFTQGFTAPPTPGPYTADYMTLDMHWNNDWGDLMQRTIWRGARAPFCVQSPSCSTPCQ